MSDISKKVEQKLHADKQLSKNPINGTNGTNGTNGNANPKKANKKKNKRKNAGQKPLTSARHQELQREALEKKQILAKLEAALTHDPASANTSTQATGGSNNTSNTSTTTAITSTTTAMVASNTMNWQASETDPLIIEAQKYLKDPTKQNVLKAYNLIKKQVDSGSFQNCLLPYFLAANIIYPYSSIINPAGKSKEDEFAKYMAKSSSMGYPPAIHYVAKEVLTDSPYFKQFSYKDAYRMVYQAWNTNRFIPALYLMIEKCFENGLGVDDWNDHSDAYLKMAFNHLQYLVNVANYKEAYRLLAEYYLDGTCTDTPEPKTAIEILKKGIEKHQCHECMFVLGHYYLFRKFVKGSIEEQAEGIKYLTLSAATNRNSQYFLALCYKNGIGVEVDQPKAAHFFTLAADNGYEEAYVEAGDCYLNGLGVNIDYQKACEYYDIAKEFDNDEALVSYSFCLMNGLGIEVDLQAAIDNLEIVADREEINQKTRGKALYYLGLAYQKIDELEMACDNYNRADVECNHEGAKLGYAFCSIKTIEKKEKSADTLELNRVTQAFQRFTTLLNSKDNLIVRHAHFGIYQCYKMGFQDGKENTEKLKLDHLKKAAELGHVEACKLLVCNCREQNLSRSEMIMWLQKAAELGDPESALQFLGYLIASKENQVSISQRDLALITTAKKLSDGEGENIEALYLLRDLDPNFKTHLSTAALFENTKKALELLNKAASLESIDALNNYAWCLLNGIGSTNGSPSVSDIRTAMQSLKKAKDKGSLEAHFNLAFCRLVGTGIHKDVELAKREFKQALELAAVREGTAREQFTPYEFGFGFRFARHFVCNLNIEQNWSNNHVYQYALGICYLEGFGVKKEVKKALELFKLCAPYNLEARFSLIECYFEQISWQECFAEMQALLADLNSTQGRDKSLVGSIFSKLVHILEKCLTKDGIRNTPTGSNFATLLAILLWEGQSVSENKERAAALFQEVLETKTEITDPKLYRYLGISLQQGIGQEKNLSKAFKNLAHAASLGDMQSLEILSNYIEIDKPISNKDRDDLITAIESLKDSRFPAIANKIVFLIGIFHYSDRWGRQNTTLAFNHFKRSADDLGNSKAYPYLVTCYRQGVGTNKDNTEMLKYLQLGANTDKRCAFELGIHFLKDNTEVSNHSQDTKRALELLWGAKESDNEELKAEVDNALGVCKFMGWGEIQSRKEAYQKFEAAKSLCPDAEHNVAFCQLFGLGTKEDLKSAVASLEQLKGKGNVAASYTLAWCSLSGLGVPKDRQKAEQLFKDAFQIKEQAKHRLYNQEQGLGLYFGSLWTETSLVESLLKDKPEALLQLAICHMHGFALKKDPVKAFALLRNIESQVERSKNPEFNIEVNLNLVQCALENGEFLSANDSNFKLKDILLILINVLNSLDKLNIQEENKKAFYQQGMMLLEPFANTNQLLLKHQAQWELGMRLFTGKGIDKNWSRARQLLSEAIPFTDQFTFNDPAGFRYLALCHQELSSKDRAETQNLSYAILQLKEEIVAGTEDGTTVNLLAEMLFHTPLSNADRKSILDLFVQASENGSVDARQLLGFCYLSGFGFEQDIPKAQEYLVASESETSKNSKNLKPLKNIKNLKGFQFCFESFWSLNQVEKMQAAAQDNLLANLGLCYLNAFGVQRDFDKAIRLFSMAEKSSSIARQGLIYCHLKGVGVKADPKSAFNRMQSLLSDIGASKTFTSAMFCCDNQTEYKVYLDSVKPYLELINENGCLTILVFYAECLLFGNGASRDVDSAINVLHAVWEMYGREDAAKLLYWCYKHQIGVNPAPEYEHDLQQFLVGKRYFEVAADIAYKEVMSDEKQKQEANHPSVNAIKESFNILFERSNNNDANALNNLGVYFDQGIGVEKDPAKAFEYFTKASQIGLENGCADYNLAICYVYGKGTNQDLDKAQQCYFRASQHMDVSSEMTEVFELKRKQEELKRKQVEEIRRQEAQHQYALQQSQYALQQQQYALQQREYALRQRQHQELMRLQQQPLLQLHHHQYYYQQQSMPLLQLRQQQIPNPIKKRR